MKNEPHHVSTENILPDKQGVAFFGTTDSSERVTYFQAEDVLVSNIRPYFKKMWFATTSGGCNADVLCFRALDKRYSTLDFPAENRVPTGMLRAPIGNPAAKRCSLCNPSFSSQVHIQTAKMQLAMPALKMQKEACTGAWHRLPFGRQFRRKGR